MNYELIRKKLIEIFDEYGNSKTKSAGLTRMKEVVNEYDSVIEVLEETLNCSFGIMDAIVKGDLKGEEEKQIVDEITKELKGKTYLGA